jgi:hypothetical protein
MPFIKLSMSSMAVKPTNLMNLAGIAEDCRY